MSHDFATQKSSYHSREFPRVEWDVVIHHREAGQRGILEEAEGELHEGIRDLLGGWQFRFKPADVLVLSKGSIDAGAPRGELVVTRPDAVGFCDGPESALPKYLLFPDQVRNRALVAVDELTRRRRPIRGQPFRCQHR